MWPFTEKAAPERGPTDAPKQPEVLYLSSGMAVAVIEWKDYVAAQQAMCHPIVYRALNKIAESVQQAKWQVVEDPAADASERRGKATIIKTLQGLLDSPNGELTPAMFRYWSALNYGVYGRMALKVSFRATDTAMPNGLYPLEARYVYAKLSERAVATAYEYGTGEGKQTYPSLATKRPGQSFVEQVWKPGLRGFQHKDESNTPLQAVGLPAMVVRELLIRALNSARGVPNIRYMVTCSGTLTEPQKQALKTYLNKDHGPEGPMSGQIPILQNAADIKIHDLKNDLSDIHTKMPSDDMARLIFGAFGIPIALAGMGAADGAKFAGNYIESRQSFWQDTVIPGYINPITGGLTRILCPPGVKIEAQLDDIPALQDARTTSMSKVSEVSFLTTNEKRSMFGYKATTEIPATIAASTPTSEE